MSEDNADKDKTPKQIEALSSLMRQANRAAIFTGAGISTESGIPDFRSPNGIWTRMKPIEFSQYIASEDARREAWRRKFAMDEELGVTKPNLGHFAIARLMERGKVGAVITQNIDNLHQDAGADPVIEIHGNATYAKCLDCAKIYLLADIKTDFMKTSQPPYCDCGGIVKLATISFGQAMPQKEMARAEDEIAQCDLFLAIGSSLQVFPAASLPLLAKQRGAALVIINREPTDFDQIADLVIHNEIGLILDGLAKAFDN